MLPAVLDLAAGFATAILSGMGVGGGGLLMVYLTLYRRLPTVTAQGVNLLCFLCASVASLLAPPPKDPFSLPRPCFWGMAALGLCGAGLGSLWSARLPTRVFRKIFGGFLCASGGYALFTSLRSRRQSRR